MNYKDYLKSDYWKKRRLEFKSKTHLRCYLCRSKENLQVHHKRYTRNGKSILFKEKHTDFRLLCKQCHSAVHKLGLMETLAKNLMPRRKIRDLIKKSDSS